MSSRATVLTRARRGRVFVVSGPSGGGKTTVVRRLLRAMPRLVRSVSVTTRPRRRRERDGADYRFLSRAAFATLRRRGQLVEWARVHHASYGTPRASVERALRRGDDVILCIDVQGARKIRRQFGQQAALIFVMPPSLGDLRARLVNRRTEDAAAVRQRLAAARRELRCTRWYDYAVVNRDLQRTVSQLKAIVTAERLRVRATGSSTQTQQKHRRLLHDDNPH